MDLFRRIFGKTGEEPINKQSPTPDSNTKASGGEAAGTSTVGESSEQVEELDELDASTRPILESDKHIVTNRPPIEDGVTQPLSMDNLATSSNERIIFGQSSDVGLIRSNNQDAVLSFFSTGVSADDQPDFGVFIVADGMGGHHDGEKASAVTTRVTVKHILSEVYLPLISTEEPDEDRKPLAEILIEGVQKANAEVLKKVPEGGTTVTAAVVMGDLAHIAHVGDSRAYLITKDGIEQLTRDHSLVQRLIELGQLTAEEASEHPQKNVLYRALGQNESLEVDTLTRRLPANSRLLICSDGLWGLVPEQELFELAMNTADPQQACEKLVALANTLGGQDNITVILLKIS